MAFNIFNKKEEKNKKSVQAPRKEITKAPDYSASEKPDKKSASAPIGDASGFKSIEAAHVSEKASMLSSSGRYVFRVFKNSNKIEIKKDIEKLYKVSVESVNIVKAPSKSRRIGKITGIKPGYKKAIVTLAKGQTIDIVPR